MKFLKIILIVFITALFLSVASAGANVSKINFQGVDFNIPDGFNKSGDDFAYNDLGSDAKSCRYVNDLNETIEITVVSDWMGMSLDELYKDGASHKSINGHKGWSYKENGLDTFSFMDGDVAVIVSLSNQTLLSQIII